MSTSFHLIIDDIFVLLTVFYSGTSTADPAREMLAARKVNSVMLGSHMGLTGLVWRAVARWGNCLPELLMICRGGGKHRNCRGLPFPLSA